MQKLRDDTTLTTEQQRSKMRDLMKSSQNQVDAILTADQQAKLKELREQARKKMEEMRKKGTTPANPDTK